MSNSLENDPTKLQVSNRTEKLSNLIGIWNWSNMREKGVYELRTTSLSLGITIVSNPSIECWCTDRSELYELVKPVTEE